MTDTTHADPFARALEHGFSALVHLPEISSTNSALMARVFGNEAAAAEVLWADQQTGGRGRRGRRWMGCVQSSLMFSVMIERSVPPGQPPPMAFSLVTGLVVAQILAKLPHGAPIHLKWPNDILSALGKVAGILIETRRHGPIERIVVGVGINLQQPTVEQADLPPEAAWLLPARAGLADAARIRLMADLAVAIDQALADYDKQGFAVFANRWNLMDAYAGQEVQLTEDTMIIASGVCKGVDETGALLIQSEQALGAYAIGDLSLRPVASQRVAA